jgi:hypothetical protein
LEGGGEAVAEGLVLGCALGWGEGGVAGVGGVAVLLGFAVEFFGAELVEFLEDGVADDLEVGAEVELGDGVGEGALGAWFGVDGLVAVAAGGGGEGSARGVEGVVLDGGAVGVGLEGGGVLAVDAGEVGAGGGEDAEQGAGVLVFDVSGGGEAEELGEASLDGVEVDGFGEGELGVAGDGAELVGAAGGVVVVAEGLAVEGWGAALVSVGEDVAAVVGLGGVHVRLSWGVVG